VEGAGRTPGLVGAPDHDGWPGDVQHALGTRT
jgi:hypothetical protein